MPTHLPPRWCISQDLFFEKKLQAALLPYMCLLKPHYFVWQLYYYYFFLSTVPYFWCSSHLLHLELDGRAHFLNLVHHVFVVGQCCRELASFVQTRAQDTRNLPDQTIWSQESIVPLGWNANLRKYECYSYQFLYAQKLYNYHFSDMLRQCHTRKCFQATHHNILLQHIMKINWFTLGRRENSGD